MAVPQGSGSGFIWDKDGNIVTNYHVIRGASDLRCAARKGLLSEEEVLEHLCYLIVIKRLEYCKTIHLL